MLGLCHGILHCWNAVNVSEIHQKAPYTQHTDMQHYTGVSEFRWVLWICTWMFLGVTSAAHACRSSLALSSTSSSHWGVVLHQYCVWNVFQAQFGEPEQSQHELGTDSYLLLWTFLQSTVWVFCPTEGLHTCLVETPQGRWQSWNANQLSLQKAIREPPN